MLLYYDTDPSFPRGARISIGGANNPKSVNLSQNLEPGTEYYWRVQDVCGQTRGPVSAAFSFTAGSGGAILPAPTLTTPMSGTLVMTNTVTLEWTAVPGAAHYNTLVRRVGSGGYLSNLATNSSVLYSLEPDSTYEWSARAGTGYAVGDWSETWQFDTGSFDSASP